MFFVLYLLVTIFSPSWEKFPKSLEQKLQSAGEDEYLTVIVIMKPFPDYNYVKTIPSISSRAFYLKTIAEESQRDIKDFLKSKLNQGVLEFESYWVYNGLRVIAKKNIIEEILKRDDVLRVELEPEVHLIRSKRSVIEEEQLLAGAPWNMRLIKADSAWYNGFKGEGIVIGGMDTGVDTSHPAFIDVEFKGKDFTGEGDPFYDGHGHGTHTTGTQIGGEGNFGTYDIGVAPGVSLYVMAKIFNSSGIAGNISAAFEYIASLKVDSGINIRAVNNSWGSCNRTSLAYWSAIETWRSLEIFPVFSIGNNGSRPCGTSPDSSGTAGTPGNYPIVIGVGTVSSTGCYDGVGQRGPAPDTIPWNDPTNWFYSSWNLLKPDIAAPGSGVVSSIPGGGYRSASGSSMAAPHVTGALALLFQANPSLTVDSAYKILINTTQHVSGCGYSYPNDRVGWGVLNVWGAIKTQLGNPIVYVVSYDTSNAGNVWEPGESMSIDFILKNIGQEGAYNLTGKLRTTNPYVTIIDSTGSWRDLLPGDSALNNDNFSVYADPGTPNGTWVDFILYFKGINSQGDTFKWTYSFRMMIGKLGNSYFDIPAGNAILSVSNKGIIPTGGNGVGFVWPKKGSNLLYSGSIVIASDSFYVVDAWYDSLGGYDSDFAPRDGLWWINPFKGDTMAVSEYDDSKHVNKKNIWVKQFTYAFSDPSNPGCGNGVIVELKIYNKSNSSVSSLYAGFFLDFDIGGSTYYNQNQGNIDFSRNLIYMYYSNTYAGVTLLYPSTGFHGKFINNPLFIYPDGKPTEGEKYLFLSGQLGDDTASVQDDWSVTVSFGPFNLAPYDTQKVVFAIVGGNSVSNLQQNVDYIKNCYTNISETFFKPDPKILTLKLIEQDNKFKIVYSLPYIADVRIDLIDLAGRILKSFKRGKQSKGVYEFEIKRNILKSGVYFIKLKTQKESKVLKLLNIR